MKEYKQIFILTSRSNTVTTRGVCLNSKHLCVFPTDYVLDVPYHSVNEQQHETPCSVAGVVFCEVVTESLNIIHIISVLQRRRILCKCNDRS